MTNLLLVTLIVVGLVILYPITPRYFAETKKLWITVGTILVHIGAYGFLWLYLSGIVFVSLFLFELGLFILWDPFRFCPLPQKKFVNTIGVIVAAAGIIISLSWFTSFPFWLWTLPLILALLPYVIPPLARRHKSILALSIILVIVYLGIMGLKVYRRFVPAAPKTVSTEKTETFAAPETPQPPLPAAKTPGPVTKAIQGIDEKIQGLEEENARLKTELEILRNENLKLRESAGEKNREIGEMKGEIEKIKGAVETL